MEGQLRKPVESMVDNMVGLVDQSKLNNDLWRKENINNIK